MKNIYSFLFILPLIAVAQTVTAQNAPSPNTVKVAIDSFLPNQATQGKSLQGEACEVEKMLGGDQLFAHASNLKTVQEDTDKRWAAADVSSAASGGSITQFSTDVNSLTLQIKNTNDEQDVPFLYTLGEVRINRNANGSISVEVREKSSFNLFGWDEDYTCLVGEN